MDYKEPNNTANHDNYKQDFMNSWKDFDWVSPGYCQDGINPYPKPIFKYETPISI